MTNPDVEGARRKLGRAREHVFSFQREFDAWSRTNPEPYSTGARLHPKGHGEWIIVEKVEEVPAFVGTVLGDFLNDARSCLDHIAWQIVQHGHTPNLKPRQERQVYFPICDTEDELNKQFSKRVPGIREAEKAIVRRYQPYARGDASPAEHPLAILRGFSRLDKHRAIPVVFWIPSSFEMEVDDWVAGCEPEELIQGPDLGGPLRVDAKLVFVKFKTPNQCSGQVHVHAKTTITVGFKQGWRLDAVVEAIAGTVSELLGEIDRVL